MNNKVLVYGSLREEGYNFSRFLNYFPNGIKYEKTIELDGYELYDLGPYPAACKGEGKIVVDTLVVSDECLETLNGMEDGAGYSINKVVVDGGEYIIYLFTKEEASRFGRVESGDYIKYLKEMKKS